MVYDGWFLAPPFHIGIRPRLAAVWGWNDNKGSQQHCLL